MSYQEAISWLFTQFPAYQKIGQTAYKPGLDNVLELCEELNVDFQSMKFIHVAGTNGKGSTSSMLASIFQESGFKTGLFTSPHIIRFTERIKVNGNEIPEEDVITFCKEIQDLKLSVKPSFFEITWVLALKHFIAEKCDYCIIETGLGGRLDATNIITPLLSIITNIGYDHMAILGNTLPEIAKEKAGIIKRYVPVVIGEVTNDTKVVFERTAQLQHAPLYFVDHIESNESLNTNYLQKNKNTVVYSCTILNQTYGIELEVTKGIEHVVQNTGFYGRFQKIQENPTIIVDAAHNEAGLSSLMKLIDVPASKLHILYGTTQEKNLNELVPIISGKGKLHFVEFNSERSKKYSDYRLWCSENGKNVAIYSKIQDFLKKPQHSVNKEDTILITGSFFLLSDFFDFFYKKDLQK